MKTLLPNVRQHLLEFLVGVLAFHQTHIERGLGLLRHGVLRLFANISAAQAANIQRRQLKQLDKPFAATLRFGELELSFEISVIIRHLFERSFLGVSERYDVVVEALNQYASIVRFHRSEKPHQLETWIWRPVSVVTAVQGADWPKSRDSES